MLISLNWLKELIDFDLPSTELAERLSLAGLEVEASKTLGQGLDQVFSATVLEKNPHPEADRLSLCQVACAGQVLSIVCGATNFGAGDRVVLARVGAKLPNGLKIKESKIRGQLSQGMLCSQSELGLEESSAGIWVLPETIAEGQPITQVLPLLDEILEVNVTPNRGDCLSLQGLAREVGALLAKPLPRKKITPVPANSDACYEVKNQAPQACSRYFCRVLKGVKIAPSPLAVQLKLKACGLKPINNVVDATNELMLETGQPLHAFDLKALQGSEVQLRFAHQGETIRSLDGVDRKLRAQDLLIADSQQALAVAGVMGGEASAVSESTVDLLLESAHFNPKNIRGTAKALGLQTDSSYRFERGVDPAATELVLEELTRRLVERAGAHQVGPITGQGKAPAPKQVLLQESEIKRHLGLEIAPAIWSESLKALGLDLQAAAPKEWQVSIPTFRSDLSRPIDLIEEIARLYGYDRIPEAFPQISLEDLASSQTSEADYQAYLRKQLQAGGYSECLHYSFTLPKDLSDYGLTVEASAYLANPLSENWSVMRPALFPQLLNTLVQNHRRGASHLKLFELRPVYGPGAEQNLHLSLASSAFRHLPYFKEKPEPADLLDLKGFVESLVEGCLGGVITYGPMEQDFLHPQRQATLLWQAHLGAPTQSLGFVGQLHPQCLQDRDLEKAVSVAEIDLAKWAESAKKRSPFKSLSAYPQVARDLNLVVEESLSQGEVAAVLAKAGGKLLKSWRLLEIYRGKPLAEGKKALTYRLLYGSKERSLTDKEVNQAREKLLQALAASHGVALRA